MKKQCKIKIKAKTNELGDVFVESIINGNSKYIIYALADVLVKVCVDNEITKKEITECIKKFYEEHMKERNN